MYNIVISSLDFQNKSFLSAFVLTLHEISENKFQQSLFAHLSRDVNDTDNIVN